MPLSLSERTLAISPSVTLAVDSRAKQLRAEGMDVIGFSAGEPDFCTPEYINDAGKFAIDAGITRYTPVAGTLDLRQKICEKFFRDNSVEYTPAEVIVSSGAKQSIFTALNAILNPGDEVLLPSPCWLSYPEMVRMAGGVPVMVHGYEENNFVVTADMLRPYVTEKTKALIINSPNNPNGCVWSHDELMAIAELAVECGFYVISDEIYEKLIYDGEKHYCMASFGPEIKKQCIVVNGVSKTYAMTGWRIGFAAAGREIVQVMSNYLSHSLSGTCSIAQAAAEEAFGGSQAEIEAMRRAFEVRRDYLYQRMSAIPGVHPVRSEATFYMLMNLEELIGRTLYGVEIRDADDFANVFLREGLVAVVPCTGFGAPHYVRWSFAVSMENIKEGLDRLEKFLANA